jgi:tripartite-type tricarboxylate transporter receptor subunit TctC
VNYSSLGNGSSAHLTMELFLSEAGITATHIPFNLFSSVAPDQRAGSVEFARVVA